MEGTGLIAAKCPSCGATVSVKKGVEARCEFCGSEFIVRESYQGKTREIRDYYELAYAAQQAGDGYVADTYFDKVLELDDAEALAWYGKGVLALGGSDVREINVKGALIFFKSAHATVEEEEKDRLAKMIQESCFCYADSSFTNLWYSSLIDEDNFRGIFDLFNFADEVSPLDNGRLKRLVEVLCKYSRLSMSFSPQISLSPFSVVDVTPRAVPYKNEVERYTEKIRRTEPTYVNPWESQCEMARTFITIIIIVLSVFVITCLAGVLYVLVMYLINALHIAG